MNEHANQEALATLYRQAFAEFGRQALWSSRPVETPGREDALAITESPRVEGDLKARELAERIEDALRTFLPPRRPEGPRLRIEVGRNLSD